MAFENEQCSWLHPSTSFITRVLILGQTLDAGNIMAATFTDENKEKSVSNIKKILQSVNPPINNNNRFKWLRVIGGYFSQQSHVWECHFS